MKRKENYRPRSIGRIFTVTFITLILIMAIAIGYPVFTNWYMSVRRATSELAGTLNYRINEKIDSYIHAPLNINEVNYRMLQDAMVNLSDEKERNSFFVDVLSAYKGDIYSFSYCTADGDYYGAIYNKDGMIEIIKNLEETNRETRYFPVNDDMTTGVYKESTGKTDPRLSDWYHAAEIAKTAVFSPVYKCSLLNEMAISAVYPIYTENGTLKGVLASRLLLPDISDTFSEIVRNYGGSVAIVEKSSGNLIANSVGIANYALSDDGKLIRKGLDTLNNAAFDEAYRAYCDAGIKELSAKGANGRLAIHVQNYQELGLDWVILSAVPEKPLSMIMMQNIYITIFLVILIVIVSVIVFSVVSRKLLKPIDKLLYAAEKFSEGELDQRAPVVRNDEIGRISEAFNKVADALQQTVEHLNETVASKTAELNESNERLLLILNSTAEAIFGTDLEGNCTFCNNSCLNLLGYSDYRDLLGKNIYQVAHTAFDNGTFKPEQKMSGTAYGDIREVHSVSDTFRKADGSLFDVAYQVLPQSRNGEIIGSVVSFVDITERKKRDERIRFLSCHDSMTGLLNRGCFEQRLRDIDEKEETPVSIIYIDLNGLKMMNDTFGHSYGDALIIKAGEVLAQNCRSGDIAARVGGDEFCVLLPATGLEEAKVIATRLREEFANHRINEVPCSMAVGSAAKTENYQQIEKVMEAAETEMYREKVFSTKRFGVNAIRSIISTLHDKYPKEKRHSEEVSRLCGALGEAMQLPEPEIRKLKDAGYLHDIGKTALSGSIISKDAENLTEDENYSMRQHPATGYRLLNLSEETLDLANGVYGHHEFWDGSGYPKGLRGEEIPLISRIITVVETYERIRNQGNYSRESMEEALQVIRENAGIKFDPAIAESFIKMIMSQKDTE